jgi:hypothetical protein
MRCEAFDYTKCCCFCLALSKTLLRRGSRQVMHSQILDLRAVAFVALFPTFAIFDTDLQGLVFRLLALGVNTHGAGEKITVGT